MGKADVQALSDRITGVIGWARDKGITHAEVVGVLEIVKLDVYQEIIQGDDNVQPE